MPLTEALVGAIAGGGFALAGAAMQQYFAARSDRARFERDRVARRQDACLGALTQFVVAARRVQRALAGRRQHVPGSHERLQHEIDNLAEAGALVRVLLADHSLSAPVEKLEEEARRIQRAGDGEPTETLKITPLIKKIHAFQSISDPVRGTRSVRSRTTT